ncbi:uncharacterized protein LOC123257680 [Drosophila ananassae]|uniref:uncharacterized protein LOC123257680 n=1 Tax=Drosophila ananassae TaxID=7217 RepID=UPI001CFFD1F3|nr:uncharacterized protein LOC123257680 [Drosophila ananassae]
MNIEVCQICENKNETASENWVQCDVCGRWYHFECAGVEDDIESKDWSCDFCLAGCSHIAPYGSMQRSPVQPQTREDAMATPEPHDKALAVDTLIDMAGSGENTHAQEGNPERNRNQLLLKMLEEKRQSEAKFIEEKYKLLMQMNPTDVPEAGMVRATDSPTSSQIAARQAIPKDLPTFSGDPEEWPLFISTFEHSTTAAGYTNVENMLRLQKSLKGKARELIRDKLLLPNLVPDVISTLKMFFGRPEHILERMVEKVRRLAPPKDRLEALIEYALAVRNVCAIMEACDLKAHLNNPMLVKELVDKLPNQHKLNWAMQPRDDRIAAVKAFSDWLYKIAEAASSVVAPSFYKSGAVNTHNSRATQGQARSNASQTEAAQQQVQSGCVACGDISHRPPQCQVFLNLDTQHRWQIITSSKACFCCLKVHRNRCRTGNCGINGCTRRHHELLHTEQGSTQNLVSTHQDDNYGSQFFRIIPVKLRNGSRMIEIYAFLDEGSSVTLVDASVFQRLGIQGQAAPMCLQWTAETTRIESESVKASVQISETNSDRFYWLNNVQTVQNLALPKQTVEMKELRSRFQHLRDLPLESYSAQPTLLIGSNNWKLAVPRRIREGKWNEPIASKCMLGWTIQGSTNPQRSIVMHHCDCDWQELHDDIKDHYNLETLVPRKLYSAEDKLAVKILETTCQEKSGKYEVGFPWRGGIDKLPESRGNALKRLTCIKKKVSQEPEMYDKIDAQVRNLLDKGYAVKLSKEETCRENSRTWYLPIFIARNPNKPSKLRLVWDAAAKSHGCALNDYLLKGPDCLNPLIEVLLAFRVNKIAICGDIAEMFHRINIREEDMHAQRFLWYDRSSDKVETYVMRAMTFGISCAPFIAHFVRDKNAEAHQEDFPLALNAIQKAHYVDDYIDSMRNEQEAIQTTRQVIEVHRRGGFEIRNWSSNSKEVLKSLQSNGNVGSQEPVDFCSTEKILGMSWDPHKDVFKFLCRFARLKRDVLAENVVPTKREVLQVLMSIFDPLGFLSCHTIGLKILLQRIWRLNIDWDQELPEKILEDWRLWKTLLGQIRIFEVPRCFSPDTSDPRQMELHTFVDASEYAYSAVCYLRVAMDAKVDVSLVIAKSKVAPLKPLSIPRMELQAAVMGTRLAHKVMSTRNLRIDNATYWSDSKTVLQWLTMDPRNFHQFVMHRVAEILETTQVEQWRWVPSKLNVADGATKITDQTQQKTWITGPGFLKAESSHWPTSTKQESIIDTSEIRKHVMTTCARSVVMFNAHHFSSWRRMYRAVAIIFLFVDRLRAKCAKQDMPTATTMDHVRKAKILLYKQSQAIAFAEELKVLSVGATLRKGNRLVGLNAYVDNDGVLRTRGRLNSIDIAEDAIILAPGCRITNLIVRSFHEKYHHLAHETAINDIKASFYISRLRVLYKSVRSTCQRCKVDSAAPRPPQMAPIPRARIGSFQRPFTYTGVDYFGPLLVNVGRRKEKRWIALFTCLTLRAVHFEIAYSLDTSSCIMCLSNFMALRGTPKEIFSDNGTNFRATEKAVREELKKIEHDKITIKFDGINYSFNDEGLRNALMEAQFIINSRPLTFVSLDTEDDAALTPNHLLLGSANGYKPLPKEGMNLQRRWIETQRFGDRFWQRWIKEYAPVLTRRTKWFEKVPPITIGSIVVIVDELLPRNLWLKGRVIDTMKAKDGQVRRVTIKTQHGVLERPATKIAVLDVGLEDGN